MLTFYGCSMYWGVQCLHFYLMFFLNITIWWILWQFHNLKNVHGNFHFIILVMFRFSYNFRQEDKTHVLLKDMQKFVLFTQQKRKWRKVNNASTKWKGKKQLIEIPKSTCLSRQSTRIGKTMSRMSIKHKCQRFFIAKQPYLDHNICQLIHLHAEHTNKGKVCHMTIVIGYRHASGSQLYDAMKSHLM
jgi:hypothetical protein